MVNRTIINDQYYYHIYNRGTDKRKIFLEKWDYVRFLNEPKLVDIICYCLNSNHYHLLVKQTTKNGISKFMHKLSLGYTSYFNDKYRRIGSLFQGKYKFKPVKLTE